MLLDEVISHLIGDDPKETSSRAYFKNPPTLLREFGKIFGLRKLANVPVSNVNTGALARSPPRKGAEQEDGKLTFKPRKKGKKGKDSKDWTIQGESAKEALYLARSVLEVLFDNIPKILDFKLEDQLSFYLVARDWPEKSFKSFAKYVTAYPEARYMQQDLPNVPKGFSEYSTPLVFKGPIRRVLRNRLIGRHSNSKDVLWLSYLQGIKRGAYSVSNHTVQESLNDHAKAMLAKPEGNDEELLHLQTYIDRALRSFEFREPKLHEPSRSGSYCYKKGQGGQAAEVLSRIEDHMNNAVYDPIHSLGYESDDEIDYTGNDLLRMVETRPGTVQEMRGLQYGLNPFQEIVNLTHELTKDREHLCAKVIPIKEPLKVRLITKGEALPYWLSKTAQKDMHAYLQRYPQFHLTGREMNMGDPYAIITREKAIGLHDFDKWVSGDYSAATDGLDIRMTMRVFDTMLSKAPHYSPKLKGILRKVIGPHHLQYKIKGFELDESLFEDDDACCFNEIQKFRLGGNHLIQQNGQLMGSPLSFPILCLINVICYWSALEAFTGEKYRLEQLPVIVNGDDILFRANDAFYEVWKQSVAKVGFKLSLGKNYIHPRLLTVNSILYRYNPELNTLTELNYLNVGLLTGQAYKTGRGNVKTLPIWDHYNKVVPKAKNPLRAHRRFIHYHLPMIKRITGNGLYNLFVPHERGGLGFKAVGPVKLTSFQRRLASYLEDEYLENLKKGVNKQSRITLVRERPLKYKRSIAKFHNPGELKLEPKVGPMKQQYRNYDEPKFDYPLMSSQTELDAPDLVLRLPKKATKRIKEARPNRMSSKKIFDWNYRVVEERELPPTLPLSVHA